MAWPLIGRNGWVGTCTRAIRGELVDADLTRAETSYNSTASFQPSISPRQLGAAYACGST
jgi:hypothetical protein